jgi:N6-adenosine-specific RNA methylase IME4
MIPAAKPWLFEPLTMFGYDIVMIDPPWPTKMRSPKGEAKSSVRHYGSMTFADIAALPVGQLLKRDAFVFLWCTWPLLLWGGDPSRHYVGADASYSPIGACLKAWGVRYVSGGPWLKRTVNGKVAFRTGYRFRSATEPFLLGVTGAPKNSRSERNLIDGLAREHSRKPEEAFAFCERYVPGGRFCEIFSRASRPGWDTWGHEAGKFDPVVIRNSPALEGEKIDMTSSEAA